MNKNSPSTVNLTFIMVSLILLINFGAFGNDFYVSPKGNDANPGTKELPLQTIGKAVDLVKQKGGGNCIIMPGIYPEQLNIKNFKPSSPVTIRGFTGNAKDVIVTSLEKVTQRWQQVEPGIWRAKVTPGKPLLHTRNQVDYFGKDISKMYYSALVFKNSRPLNLARYPNKPTDSNDLMKVYAGKVDVEKSTAGGGAIYKSRPTFIGKKVDGAYHIYTKFLAELPEKYTSSSLKGAYIWGNCWKRWTSYILPIEEVVEKDSKDPKTGATIYKEALKARTSSPWIALNMTPGHEGKGHTNTAYIVGARVLLDAEDEYHYTIDHADPDNSYIEIFSKKDPNAEGKTFYYKSRSVGLELENCKNIHLASFTFRAAGIYCLAAQQCIIDRVRIEMPTWGYGISNSNLDASLPGIKGGLFLDRNCSEMVVKNCHIKDCAGTGVRIDGKDSFLHNNLIENIDYLGVNEQGVQVNGMRQTVSYNTIRRAGRTGLQIGCRQSRIIYNDIYDVPYLTHDCGAIHSNNDKDNSEIAYNWIHNVNPGSGIYLDNFSNNWLIHHNVVWDINGNSIQLNVPCNFVLVANNTVLECRNPEGKGYLDKGQWKNKKGNITNPYMPWKGPSLSFGSVWANNLALQVWARKHASNGLNLWFNKTYSNKTRILSDDFSQGFDSEKHSPEYIENKVGRLQKRGVSLPGITEEKLPDIGAYQNNSSKWQAGCNLQNPPSLPDFKAPAYKYRNLISNSSFNFAVGGKASGTPPHQRLKVVPQTVPGWETKGNGIAEIRYFSGFAGAESTTSPSDRNSIYDNSLLISSETNAEFLVLYHGVDEMLKDLDFIQVDPGKWYTFSAYLRLKPDTEPGIHDYHDLNQSSINRPAENDQVSDKDGVNPAEIELIAVDEKGKEIKAASLSGMQSTLNWYHKVLEFQAPQNGKIKVGFRKKGKGNCYIDNLGFTLKYPINDKMEEL